MEQNKENNFGEKAWLFQWFGFDNNCYNNNNNNNIEIVTVIHIKEKVLIQRKLKIQDVQDEIL